MRRCLSLWIAIGLTVFVVRAQQQRIPCVRSGAGDTIRAHTRGTRSVSKLTGKVRIPVILAAYPDRGFKQSDAQTRAYWDAILNQHGYSEHGAQGCVSDYFIVQSSGMFEPVFDILGPVMLPDSMAYYGKNVNNREGDDRRPAQMILDACRATEADFSPYDWDSDGYVDVVMVVYAGTGENRGGGANSIWPHMSSIGSSIGNNLYLNSYACVSELRDNDELDGFGTFCHEMSHCLGLPDLYPISGSAYSFFDEWDLMDGGNYANKGFGIPNYSAFERKLCGWLSYQELSVTTTIVDMPVFDEQPVAYVVYNDGHPTEYFILENRQQRGWDYYVPGNGLLVTHVCDYLGSLSPNSYSRVQVSMVNADNRTYRENEDFFGTSKYGEDGRNKYLSGAAYPYITDSICNDSLTNNSVPAALLQKENLDGSLFLSKPITGIRIGNNGQLSCKVTASTPVAIPRQDITSPPTSVVAYYDLRGHRLSSQPRIGIYLVRYSDGSIRKVAY